MRLFSNRRRPFHFGRYPMETLARVNGRIEAEAHRTSERGDLDATLHPHALFNSIDLYSRLFAQYRDSPVAVKRAEIDVGPAGLSDNVKASCYFLDANMVGICKIPVQAWCDAPDHPDHSHAVVIVVEYSRDPRPDDPGSNWIRGTQRARAELRAAEIAVVIAGYIRRLGFGARAHTGVESDLDDDLLIICSGLGENNSAGGRAVNPFIGHRYGAAVVSTDMPLTPDRPLAQRGAFRRLLSIAPSYWLGVGGGLTVWDCRRAKRRPLHLGPHRMEKIKRTSKTTTLITDDVTRVPRRAGFFVRAEFGDLGGKARTEMTGARFALKHPIASAMTPLMLAMASLQDGEIATAKTVDIADPAANADMVKAAGYYLGADMVGICEVPDYAWFSHRQNGEEIRPYGKFAIVMLIDQGFDTLDGSSGDDWISAAQSMRGYMRGEEIGGIIAHHLRRLGHAARPQTNQDSDVLHIPLILLAGLGEMSRIGELVLNPFVGPRFKSVVVTTDLPLTVDEPIDFGLQDFCSKCVKCARECPCSAIPYGGKVMFNGYEIWKPDVERCVRYRLTNSKGSACGRCMKMCPFNTEGLLVHDGILWAAIKLPWTRSWIARLDDKVGKGKRNPVKRWWFDLEMVDDVAVRPAGVNERDLDLDKNTDPEKQKLAVYTVEMNPGPERMNTMPVDRKEAQRRTATLERPDEARRRLD